MSGNFSLIIDYSYIEDRTTTRKMYSVYHDDLRFLNSNDKHNIADAP